MLGKGRNGSFERIQAFLVKRCNLTELQLIIIKAFAQRTYSISKDGRRSRYHVGKDHRGMSRGAFFRVLHQAKRNVKKAFYTIMLLSFFDMIDESAMDNIVAIGALLKELSQAGQVSDERLSRALQDIEAEMDAELGRMLKKL